MNISVVSKIDISEAMQKIESDQFWKFAAHEWHRLLIDYVPKDSGQLSRNVEIRPKEIEYKSPYAAYIYNGIKMVDPKYKKGGFTNDGGVTFWSRPGIKKVPGGQLNLKNGSRYWDKKAISEGKDTLLALSMQRWIDTNM